MRHWLSILALGLLCAAALPAQANPDLARSLSDALRMEKTLEIMAREAAANAADIAPDLFKGASPSSWADTVNTLFDPASSREAFDKALSAAVTPLNADHLATATSFFQTPLGIRLLELELSAREALLDKDVEAAAKQSWADLLADPMPASAARAALIGDVIAAGDLIESNVSSALNGNLAFYQGLAEAGGSPSEMTPDDMLAEVRAQEAEVRRETEDWLYPFLAMAYAPLSDEELRLYITFATSPAGQALNGVLFLAFDQMSTAQSRGMGLAAGRLMAGQDI